VKGSTRETVNIFIRSTKVRGTVTKCNNYLVSVKLFLNNIGFKLTTLETFMFSWPRSSVIF